jgi:hypothetical protein
MMHFRKQTNVETTFTNIVEMKFLHYALMTSCLVKMLVPQTTNNRIENACSHHVTYTNQKKKKNNPLEFLAGWRAGRSPNGLRAFTGGAKKPWKNSGSNFSARPCVLFGLSGLVGYLQNPQCLPLS